VCNIDIHMNGSGTAVSLFAYQLILHLLVLFCLRTSTFARLARIPRGEGSRNLDQGSSHRNHQSQGRIRRGSPRGSGFRQAKESRALRPSSEACPRSAAATRKLEKEKQRLKLIDTSKQSQPNIAQFFAPSA
jgi:hypothetical protein